MTPEQQQADLILGGWLPVQYERIEGNVWKGLYKPGAGLIYMPAQYLPVPSVIRRAPTWPYHENGIANVNVEELRCRWSDVREILVPLAAYIEEHGL